MAVNDSVGDFKFGTNAMNFANANSQVTISGSVDSPEIETGQLSIDSSKVMSNAKKCNFCLSELAAITLETGKDRQGFCSKCLTAIFQFVHGAMTKKGGVNEVRVTCAGCNYQINPNHGTALQGRGEAKVVCDRCLDAIMLELENKPGRFGKNIIV
jgi:hypothetical protein